MFGLFSRKLKIITAIIDNCKNTKKVTEFISTFVGIEKV
jgi:hypothetical protein